MSKFKNTPLELDNTMPKELYTLVENKWHYFLNLKKQIRESTLGQVMLELRKGKIVKENKKYGNQFAPKYRAFNILQNNIEDVVKKSTQMWKLIYGLTMVKEGEDDPFEGRNNEEEDEDREEEKKRKGGHHYGGDTKGIWWHGYSWSAVRRTKCARHTNANHEPSTWHK